MNCRHCDEEIVHIRGEWLAFRGDWIYLPPYCPVSPISLHYPVDARSILRDLVRVLGL